MLGLLLGVEDTAHVIIERRLTNLLFLLFSSFYCPFVLLFSIVLRQVCLLHQVGAQSSVSRTAARQLTAKSTSYLFYL